MHASRVGRWFSSLADVPAIVATSLKRLTQTMRRTVPSRHQQAETDEDPVLALLAAAPVDDEPLTDDDRQRMADAWQAYRDGRVVTEEEVRQQSGYSQDS